MLADPEVLPLITSTAQAFSQAVGQGIGKRPMPSAMRSLLEQNIFIFSGFKTHAELSAVSALLLDENGKKKPFEKFAQDVRAIDENYNRNYLRAEYNFATQSARSAAQWAQYQADGDQFYLQYRTAADERVRESHAILHGTTLPVDDPFWQKFFPPNGWNCRCTVVQVRKSKYPLSDSQKSIEKGEKATTALNKKGQNKLAIFRFNPGQEQKIFPPRHPYLPKGCGNCNKNQLDYKPNNPMCQACLWLKKCVTKQNDTYIETIEKFDNGGILQKYSGWDSNEGSADRVLLLGRWFAKNGHIVTLTPKFPTSDCDAYRKIYDDLKGTDRWGKCPDLTIDGVFFEHEGHRKDSNPKRWLNRMLHHGLEQSDHLIIEKTNDSLHNITWRVKKNFPDIKELWVMDGDEPKLLFRKTESQ